MNKIILAVIMIASQLITACALREGEQFEDIYTDVKVVKPTSDHYSSNKTPASNSPILKQQVQQTEQTDENTDYDTHLRIKETGVITSSSYDEEVSLYMYTLTPNDGGEPILFFYDKKLDMQSDAPVDVDIKDNYLYNITTHKDTFSAQSPAQKVKYIKHIKQNKNIPAALEVNIDTY